MQHVATVGPTDSIGRIAASTYRIALSLYLPRACVGSPGLVVCADLNESAARRVPSVFFTCGGGVSEQKIQDFQPSLR